jgi:hypothetical protein
VFICVYLWPHVFSGFLMEWIDAHPEVAVQSAEYQRLLGYPRGRVLEGRARELSDWAMAWYAEHGRPWVYAREAESAGTRGSGLEIEGVRFPSGLLQRRLEKAAASGAVLAAVSAGPELEQEAQRLWSEEKPDEYYFLEVLGSAVVERLVATTGACLCAWAEGREMAVLPHYSPGYAGWDVAQQSRLLGLVNLAGKLPGRLEALESGALRPKKSLLAVFPLTRQTEGVRRLTELVACGNCTLSTCQFRRITGEA